MTKKAPPPISRSEWYRTTYLRSYGWLNTRWHYMERVDWKCEGNSGNCQRWARVVHHLSYDNLGDEPPGDLMALCFECHDRMHGWPKADNDNQPLLPLFEALDATRKRRG